MNSIASPLIQTYWYLSDYKAKPLQGEKKCDVCIVGGGMAGLHAAHEFQKKGFSVILLEKNFCGSGASGKSSGFITPDSELPLRKLIDVYGAEDGKKLWEFVGSGVDLIRQTIHEYDFQCDYIVQDTCVVAKSNHAYKTHIQKEYQSRQELGYVTQIYDAQQMHQVLQSEHYYGAVRYPGSFGINTFQYCQELKNMLQQQGGPGASVEIYEDTPALSVGDHCIETPHGKVTADKVVLCIDRFLPDFEQSAVADTVASMQTFLMISEPLSDKQVQELFPGGSLMVWDTDILYTYYRLTSNNRLLLGGGSWFSLYDMREAFSNKHVRNQLLRYYKKHFPQLHISFRYFWPGLTQKDILVVIVKRADLFSSWFSPFFHEKKTKNVFCYIHSTVIGLYTSRKVKKR